MVDVNLQMQSVQTLRRDVIKSIKARTEAEETRAKVSELLEAAGHMVTAFNMMREVFSSFLATTKSLELDCKAISARFESITGLGVDITAAGFADDANEVEDPEKFKALLAGILGTKQPFTRLAKCIKTNEMIGEALTRWEPKLAKMRLRIGADGVGEAETKVVERKIITMDRFIEDLRVRGDTITKIYDDTDGEIQKSRVACRGKFKSMYNNKLS